MSVPDQAAAGRLRRRWRQELLDRGELARYAWLSIAAAMVTIGLKAGAYLITDSVGLLSDTLESGVNLTAAVLALTALKVAARPPDEDHAFGHGKAEYFSSGAEGILIMLAAVGIVTAGIRRLVEPQPIEHVQFGIMIMIVASVVNLVVSRILVRAGSRYRSITLEAEAHHLMTDVWTTGGVILGVGMVGLTGWHFLDPLIALAVGTHIIFVGLQLVRRSTLGLLDTAIPEADLEKITALLNEYAREGIRYHALRTRQAGARSFISLHIQVPGHWTIQRGHDLLEAIEQEIQETLPAASVFTHIEPLEDPRSWLDEHLD